ncbi:unnamed protein product, partial [Choristocarpus tenellus]
MWTKYGRKEAESLTDVNASGARSVTNEHFPLLLFIIDIQSQILGTVEELYVYEGGCIRELAEGFVLRHRLGLQHANAVAEHIKAKTIETGNIVGPDGRCWDPSKHTHMQSTNSLSDNSSFGGKMQEGGSHQEQEDTPSENVALKPQNASREWEQGWAEPGKVEAPDSGNVTNDKGEVGPSDGKKHLRQGSSVTDNNVRCWWNDSYSREEESINQCSGFHQTTSTGSRPTVSDEEAMFYRVRATWSRPLGGGLRKNEHGDFLTASTAHSRDSSSGVGEQGSGRISSESSHGGQSRGRVYMWKGQRSPGYSGARGSSSRCWPGNNENSQWSDSGLEVSSKPRPPMFGGVVAHTSGEVASGGAHGWMGPGTKEAGCASRRPLSSKAVQQQISVERLHRVSDIVERKLNNTRLLKEELAQIASSSLGHPNLCAKTRKLTNNRYTYGVCRKE